MSSPQAVPAVAARGDAQPARVAAESATRRVWDLPTRVFHWTLLIAVISCYVTNKLGVVYFRYHVWSGYAVLVLVAFRIVWGVVGTRHARFHNFVRGPVETGRYLLGLLRGRRKARYAGHNPLGALMVLLLLAVLLTQAVAGLFANDEIASLGPLYAYVSDALSLRLTSLHRQLFDWLAVAIGLHVLAVLAHRVLARENLVRAMFTGRKPAHAVALSDTIASSRIWLAVALVVAIAAALAWVVAHAPVAELQGF